LSRVFDATCVGNILTVEGKPIIPKTILSEGVKASTGVGLLQGDKMYYLTSNATDIKDLITNIGTLVDQIVLALQALDLVTVSPGSAAAAITLVSTLKTTLVLQKDMLK
jgi:hypothetical protein